MSIVINSGFNLNSTAPIDSRFIRTKTQMKNTDDSKMPSLYFCVCPDDKKFYIYDKSITTPDSETGKFKVVDAPKPTIYFNGDPAIDPDFLNSCIPGSIVIYYYNMKQHPENCNYVSWDKLGDVPRIYGPAYADIILAESFLSPDNKIWPLSSLPHVTLPDEETMNAVLQLDTPYWFKSVTSDASTNIKSAYIAYHVEDDGSVTKTIEATLTDSSASHCPDEVLIECTPADSRTDGANPWIVNYH